MFQGAAQEIFLSYIINDHCVTHPPESCHLASTDEVMVADISRHSNTGGGEGPSLSARAGGLEERDQSGLCYQEGSWAKATG